MKRSLIIALLCLVALPLGLERFLRLPPSQEKLHQAIHRSADYLKKVTLETGQFRYRINLNPKVRMRRKYNVLRHAGTLYSMILYAGWAKNEELTDEIKRSLAYFRKSFIRPVEGADNMDAAWSPPEIVRRKPLQTKLGGTGLGLVALVSAERLLPGITSREELQRLGHFALYMQKEDGSFYSKFIPSQGGRYDRWTSLYYPGETAFGLALLYGLDPNPQWLEGARKALLYLAKKREGRGLRVEPDHWALLATNQLLTVDSLEEADRKKLIAHAKQICRKILSESYTSILNPFHSGSIGRIGDTTPTATRLEGLLAALNFLPAEEKELRDPIESMVRSGMAFVMRGQVKSGEHAGAVTRSVSPFPFVTLGERAQEVRIDYVQHAMSAMIQYDRYFLQ